VTNARWRSGVEVVDLAPGRPLAAADTGWYACRRCGAVGFAASDPNLVTMETLDRVADVEGCPNCQ
jgi:hypothetical protein